MEELSKTSSSSIDAHSGRIRDIGHEIWGNPELGLHEFHAHKLLCDFFREKGFSVDDQCLGPTGFRASYPAGSGAEGTGSAGDGDGHGAGVHVCLLAEYDALPELGHASAHNLVAEACVATSLGLKAAIDLKKNIGRVTVLGTPDLEGNGKKMEAIHNGYFKGVDLAVAFVPYTANVASPVLLTVMRLTVRFKGKAAHASACPWDGRNALDAAVLCYNNISVLRQQLKPYMQIQGIISEGGLRPNIIPEHTEMKFWLRAQDHIDMAHLQQKADAAFRAAAKATGCELEFDFTSTPFSNLCSNTKLSDLYRVQAEARGMVFANAIDVVGSSDSGNVSHVVPTIVPAFDIGDAAITINTQAFAEIAGSMEAHEKTMTAAKAMCGAVLQAMVEPDTMASIRGAFESEKCTASVTEWH